MTVTLLADRPLPAPIRREMEEKFGADFTHVRIHTGAEAAELCAKAHTRGLEVLVRGSLRLWVSMIRRRGVERGSGSEVEGGNGGGEGI